MMNLVFYHFFYLSTIYPLSIHYLSTIYPLSIHYLSTIYPLSFPNLSELYFVPFGITKLLGDCCQRQLIYVCFRFICFFYLLNLFYFSSLLHPFVHVKFFLKNVYVICPDKNSNILIGNFIFVPTVFRQQFRILDI